MTWLLMPSDSEDITGSNPYEHLTETDRTWEHILESDPYTCWDYLIELFSAMNANELELQREAFQKSRMQAEELGKTSDKTTREAAKDLYEFMLLCERAANKASPKDDN